MGTGRRGKRRLLGVVVRDRDKGGNGSGGGSREKGTDTSQSSPPSTPFGDVTVTETHPRSTDV